MIWIKLKRIVRSGFYSFWRNGFVSLSSILVMMVTLFVIGSTIFSGAILGSTLNQIKDKVDVNVYFVTTAPEEEILAIKESIEKLPEVAPPVVYISKEDVLAGFQETPRE
jgi:cell division transport system permease protein